MAVGVDEGGTSVLVADDPPAAVGWGEIIIRRGELVAVGVFVASERHTSSKVISGGGTASLTDPGPQDQPSMAPSSSI